MDSRGHLMVGGCDVVDLVSMCGTPLYVFDEVTLRDRCAEFVREFRERYPDTDIIYASKAFICRAVAVILLEEGLGLDVVSAGEFLVAHSVGFPPAKVYFHGNNKSAEELELAVDHRIGRVVVDNLHELALLDKAAKDIARTQDILLRVSPGVDPHTHRHVTTGVLDSKFGFPISTGQAEEAVRRSMELSTVNLVGLHFHIGSSIFEVQPYLDAVDIVLQFAVDMTQKHGFVMTELDIGGGFAVQYELDCPAPPISFFAQAITSRLIELCEAYGIARPKLVVEPGRSIIAQAGTALYRAGSSKDIPGLRKYVSVDGGMGDNIRPALYDSKYEAVVANKLDRLETDTVTLAGRFCESGDVLIKDVVLPPIEPGDIIALPTAGAYALPMASNYNAFLRPAIVMVKNGQARLIRRRETFEDLLRYDTA
jgi:diaminopimelate decarboxylase